MMALIIALSFPFSYSRTFKYPLSNSLNMYVNSHQSISYDRQIQLQLAFISFMSKRYISTQTLYTCSCIPHISTCPTSTHVSYQYSTSTPLGLTSTHVSYKYSCVPRVSKCPSSILQILCILTSTPCSYTRGEHGSVRVGFCADRPPDLNWLGQKFLGPTLTDWHGKIAQQSLRFGGSDRSYQSSLNQKKKKGQIS